jgi:hypothetical protein
MLAHENYKQNYHHPHAKFIIFIDIFTFFLVELIYSLFFYGTYSHLYLPYVINEHFY